MAALPQINESESLVLHRFASPARSNGADGHTYMIGNERWISPAGKSPLARHSTSPKGLSFFSWIGQNGFDQYHQLLEDLTRQSRKACKVLSYQPDTVYELLCPVCNNGTKHRIDFNRDSPKHAPNSATTIGHHWTAYTPVALALTCYTSCIQKIASQNCPDIQTIQQNRNTVEVKVANIPGITARVIIQPVAGDSAAGSAASWTSFRATGSLSDMLEDLIEKVGAPEDWESMQLLDTIRKYFRIKEGILLDPSDILRTFMLAEMICRYDLVVEEVSDLGSLSITMADCLRAHANASHKDYDLMQICDKFESQSDITVLTVQHHEYLKIWNVVGKIERFELHNVSYDDYLRNANWASLVQAMSGRGIGDACGPTFTPAVQATIKAGSVMVPYFAHATALAGPTDIFYHNEVIKFTCCHELDQLMFQNYTLHRVDGVATEWVNVLIWNGERPDEVMHMTMAVSLYREVMQGFHQCSMRNCLIFGRTEMCAVHWAQYGYPQNNAEIPGSTG